MKKLLILIYLSIQLPVYSAEKTWIAEILADAEVIITPEYIIEVDSFSKYDTQLWSRLDDVIISDYYLINIDQEEKAEIKEIIRR